MRGSSRAKRSNLIARDFGHRQIARAADPTSRRTRITGSDEASWSHAARRDELRAAQKFVLPVGAPAGRQPREASRPIPPRVHGSAMTVNDDSGAQPATADCTDTRSTWPCPVDQIPTQAATRSSTGIAAWRAADVWIAVGPLPDVRPRDQRSFVRWKARGLQLPSNPSLRRAAKDVNEWAHLGLNQGPLACEASALPLSYAPGSQDRIAPVLPSVCPVALGGELAVP